MQLITGVWSARTRKRATTPGHLAPGDRDWVESRVPFPANFLPAWTGPQELPALLRPFLFLGAV